MYIEAVCPLCFACHIVREEMRGQKLRCEQCEEVFIVNKKAKTTTKKPPRPPKVKPADEPEEIVSVEAAEVLPEARLVEEPPRKAKPKADDDEVLEIPDDALQANTPALKVPTATRSRRAADDDEEERPKKRRSRDEDDEADDRPRRAPRRSGGSSGLVVVFCVVGVLLIGGIAFGAWWALSDKKPDDTNQTDNGSSDDGKTKSPPEKQAKGGAADSVKTISVAAVNAMPQVTFPSPPSAFVMVGANQLPNDERQVWNLKTGEMTGKLSGRILMQGHPVLSPDGGRVAFVPLEKRNTIEVRDIATNTPVILDVGINGPHDLIDFVGPDKLLVGHRNKTDGLNCRLFNTTTGQQERELETPRPKIPWPQAAMAISPNGAYLAVVDLNNLNIYDLKAGAAIGQRSLAKRLGGLECRGLSFSPDGTELAAVFFSKPLPQLVCWTVSDRKIVSEINFPQANPSVNALANNPAHIIGWVGNRRGWLLYGSTWIDRSKNNTATFLPEPMKPGGGGVLARLAIDPDRVVTQKNGVRPGEVVFTVGPFDPDQPR